MKLVVGLGNPGQEYENTRHNIGFMVIDNYLGNIKWKNDKKALTFKTKINNEDVLFIKPTTYMNLSGESVIYYVNYYKINANDIIVIHDDLDLKFCKIRLKINSSDGGHNGIKSIINYLNTQKFLRLKIGISKPNDNNVINFVLSKFSKEEIKDINNIYPKTKAIIEEFINNESIENIMSRYN